MEQPQKLLSPAESEAARLAAIEKLAQAVVSAWRTEIAKSMAVGQRTARTRTPFDHAPELEIARKRLEAELVATGWKQLDVAPAAPIDHYQLGMASNLGHPMQVVELRWSPPEPDAPR